MISGFRYMMFTVSLSQYGFEPLIRLSRRLFSRRIFSPLRWVKVSHKPRKGPKKAVIAKILVAEKRRARRPRATLAVTGRKLDLLSVLILMKLTEPVLKDQTTERTRKILSAPIASTDPGTFLLQKKVFRPSG